MIFFSTRFYKASEPNRFSGTEIKLNIKNSGNIFCKIYSSGSTKGLVICVSIYIMNKENALSPAIDSPTMYLQE